MLLWYNLKKLGIGIVIGMRTERFTSIKQACHLAEVTTVFLGSKSIEPRNFGLCNTVIANDFFDGDRVCKSGVADKECVDPNNGPDLFSLR